MRCIGVDLGWTLGASGLALLEYDGAVLRYLESTRILEIDAVLEWIADRSEGDCVVAVDAPLRLGNPAGMREAEKQAHRLYGRFDAGCYPSNRGSTFAARTTGFAAALENLGLPHVYPQNRCQFECFPHITAIEIFGLDRIFKYKKGPRAQRASELSRMRQTMLDKLPITGLDRLPSIPTKGNLKYVEDELDAVLCAYMAFHWGRWGLERNQILGEIDEGCIIIPRVRA